MRQIAGVEIIAEGLDRNVNVFAVKDVDVSDLRIAELVVEFIETVDVIRKVFLKVDVLIIFISPAGINIKAGKLILVAG